jgi:hypothetical protein
VYQSRGDPRVGLVLVGFSPPERLAALARRRGWPERVLADPGRVLYQRLGVGRARCGGSTHRPPSAPTPPRPPAGTGRPRPVEDTRQLGADAVMVNAVVRQLWRPRTPAGRPPAAEVIAAARAWLA